jgi:hypothetical protein
LQTGGGAVFECSSFLLDFGALMFHTDTGQPSPLRVIAQQWAIEEEEGVYIFKYSEVHYHMDII